MDGPTEMLLSWFDEDELDVCPVCGQKHLLPPWGSPEKRICATCVFERGDFANLS
jgi:hypothetical protein